MDRIARATCATTCPRSARAFVDRRARLRRRRGQHRPVQPLSSTRPGAARALAGGDLPAALDASSTAVHRACAPSPPSRRRSATAAPASRCSTCCRRRRSRSCVAVLPEFLEAASASPVLRFVDVDLKVNRPEGSVAIDRQRAAELGVSVLDVARTLQLAYGGQRFGYFLLQRPAVRGDRPGRARRPQRSRRPRQASSCAAGGGAMISLDNLVRFDETRRPGRDLPLQPLHLRDRLGRARARLHRRRRHRRARRDRGARAAARRSAPAWPASRATSPTPARACSSPSRSRWCSST